MARRSLSFSAYRALARRGPPDPPNFPKPRPQGEVLWLHVGHSQDLPAVLDLADRLSHQRLATSILLTTPEPVSSLQETTVHVLLAELPGEHPNAVAAFLDHWRPDLCLWIWGGLRPCLVHECSRRAVPMHLISADAAGFDGKRDRWLPELAKQLVRSFTSATARNAAAAQKLSKLGLASGKITVQRRLKPTGRLLPCQSSDLDDLSGQLQGRPVWLAAQVQPQEVNSVLMAHGSALRSAHRLLLVLEPADATNLNELIRALEEAGLTHATWGDGAWPEENTQVLIADLPGELGLWYRISTVSFLGSSLQSGLGGCDPLSAAALGTAILYGPNVRHHLQSYTRLANAGAARIVNDGESLGTAVSHLIAPDQAATMAHAGWDIISEGAEIIDGIIDLVQETLDSRQPELSAP